MTIRNDDAPSIATMAIAIVIVAVLYVLVYAVYDGVSHFIDNL